MLQAATGMHTQSDCLHLGSPAFGARGTGEKAQDVRTEDSCVFWTQGLTSREAAGLM